MANFVQYRSGGFAHYTSVAITSATPAAGNSLDMRDFTRGTIIASSTAGTPTLTYWAAATTTGPFRLLKTSTGGAVTTVIVANACVSMPAAVANAGHVRMVTSGAAISSLAVLLKE